ncbi:hypothetical protein M5K25_008142 [Dendrobium thyrsiflorum]|uniref:Uncharacterized protein n=1 Tax=Dendrobium thyrsiflorum TaxID=117978 RepID=A0ABD0V7N4_DENTH
MEEPLSSMDFPPLPSSAAAGPSSPARNWKNIVVESDPISKDLPLSFYPSEPEIVPFAGEKLVSGAAPWNMCLVGYSIGRRPYYEALLGAIRKTWELKGSFQLLSLSEGFFLLRFTNMEDYEMAWSKGIWFFLGKPFLLQKWSPKFRPKRENLKSVPIWIKIHDLPLVCWNSEGISRIASKIGIPLAVDALTAQRTRLTFARVCVQVSADAVFPEEVPISLEDEVFSLKIQYEWKPSPCEHCKSLSHLSSYCPTKPTSSEPQTAPAKNPKGGFAARGRSSSRKPSLRSLPKSFIPQPPIQSSVTLPPPNTSTTYPANIPDRHTAQPEYFPPGQVTPTSDSLPQNPAPPSASLPIGSTAPSTSIIPNLNSPTDEASSSTSNSRQRISSPPKVQSPNKFEALHLLEDGIGESDASTLLAKDSAVLTESEDPKPPPARSQPSKNAKGKHENRIHFSSLHNPFFSANHKVFISEDSCHNFNYSQSGRIWIKWNAAKINFIPSFTSQQMIMGQVSYGNQPSFTLSVIYASNDHSDRSLLWDNIRSTAPDHLSPWIIMGDFNCCRFATEKLGGNTLTHSRLWELNSLIFDAKLEDLHSVGSSYTWFNQRLDRPIHIKLDRILVNEAWSSTFPHSYYSIQAPSCSDHCPLILHSPVNFSVKHRFLFKNYWTSLDNFWSLLLDVFSARPIGNYLVDFCSKLKALRSLIKENSWANSNYIMAQLDDLHLQQTMYLEQISLEPMNPSLNNSLKIINQHIATATNRHASWVIQRAKAAWLSQGEDDLKFLYGKIRQRRALNNAAFNLSASTIPERLEAIRGIILHFQELYNPAPPEHLSMEASLFWKSLCTTAARIKPNLIFKVTSTAPLSLLWDYWCDDLRVIDLCSAGSLASFYNNVSVSSFIMGGDWCLPGNFPTDIAQKITSVGIYNTDCVQWGSLKKATFSDFLKDYYLDATSPTWVKFIWYKRHVLRYSVFAWLTMVGGLKTASELTKRHILVDLLCPLCHNYPESSSHLFFDCDYSHSIITKLIPDCNFLLLRPNLLQIFDWVHDCPNTPPLQKRFYYLIITCTIYFVWRERNERRFAQSSSSSSTTIRKIINAVQSKGCVPRGCLLDFVLYFCTSFTVDAFRYGAIDGCSSYFLSHFHYDHYGGLNKRWSHGNIYCTDLTARLLRSCLSVNPKYIFPLEINAEHVIEDIKVTLLEANHCPGAALILFRLKDGKCYLHTGDFRASKSMQLYPSLASHHINLLYLDTTYCNPKYSFPSKDDVLAFVVRTTLKFLSKQPKSLIVVGAYSIGKEPVYLAISQALGELRVVFFVTPLVNYLVNLDFHGARLEVPIYANASRRKILQSFGWPELSKKLCSCTESSPLHVLPLSCLRYENLKEYLKTCKQQFQTVLAFRPTGWTYSESTASHLDLIRPVIKGDVTIYGVPYSEHSSFTELREFVKFLKPEKIIPTVNAGNAANRARMQSYFKEWLKA